MQPRQFHAKSPRSHVMICIHTPIPGLGNVIQITGQMPFRFYITPLHVNLSNNISLNVTLMFHWLLLGLSDDGCFGVWITCTRSGCTCCHLHNTSQFVSDVMLNWKMKSWTVTRAIMWLLFEHGVEASKDWVFVARFINLLNTTMPMPRTDVRPETLLSHFWNRRVGMGS